ncbi:hypothetical protein BJ322DRAFT_989234, partial [Thelephora terrestris]
NLPQTPSYNGSYQNSPCTAFSELEFDVTDLSDQPDYDPAEYDAPSNIPNPLLNFMNPHVSVSVTPPIDGGFDQPFDHSSPGSSNGLPEQESESRSRASSVSSHSHYNPCSPPIHNFESLRFESPHWSTSLLPPDKPSSPSHKPPSPPSILIPDASPSMNPGDLRANTPMINAPQGDGGVMNGPQLHIVPATPISGG